MVGLGQNKQISRSKGWQDYLNIPINPKNTQRRPPHAPQVKKNNAGSIEKNIPIQTN